MGLSALLVAAVWLMLSAFLVDVLFEMTVSQRVVALLAAGGVLAWFIYRWVRPWLTRHEDEIDVALLIERRRSIDSDLVAALQFESPEAASWGSPQLEHAVVRQVAENTRRLKLVKDLPQRGLRLRLAMSVGTFAAVALIVLAFPTHAAIFVDRLSMGATLYPRDTLIREGAVNGEPKGTLRSPGVEIHCPIGRAVDFRVTCDGKLPPDGKITYQQEGGDRSVLLLKPVDNEPGVYTGRLESLVSAVDFRVSVGDDRTQEARLVASPRPVVEVVFKPTIPDYAKAAGAKGDDRGFNFSVYKGARVDLELRCLNKPLRKAMLTAESRCPMKRADEDGHLWVLPAEGTALSSISCPLDYEIEVIGPNGKRAGRIKGRIDKIEGPQPADRSALASEFLDDYPLGQLKVRVRVASPAGLRREAAQSTGSFAAAAGANVDLQVRCDEQALDGVVLVLAGGSALRQAGEGGRLWTLPAAGTPFTVIAGPLSYRIEAADEYDMRPANEISGKITLKDAPPVVEANIAKRDEVYVLPWAKPCIQYWVTDDCGLRHLKMLLEIERGGVKERPRSFSILAPTEPIPGSQLPLTKAFTFDLTDFGLAKGDNVTIRLEATDYRGRLAGVSKASKPLTLYVTDRIGLWKQLLKEDEKSESGIRQIITRTTGIERKKQ